MKYLYYHLYTTNALHITFITPPPLLIHPNTPPPLLIHPNPYTPPTQEMKFPDVLLNILTKKGIITPTGIQMQGLPAVLVHPPPPPSTPHPVMHG